MTFTIEPMITMGSWRERIWPDGWTAVTADGLRTAQFEHTLVVTDDGVEVLTPSETLPASSEDLRRASPDRGRVGARPAAATRASWVSAAQGDHTVEQRRVVGDVDHRAERGAGRLDLPGLLEHRQRIASWPRAMPWSHSYVLAVARARSHPWTTSSSSPTSPRPHPANRRHRSAVMPVPRLGVAPGLGHRVQIAGGSASRQSSGSLAAGRAPERLDQRREVLVRPRRRTRSRACRCGPADRRRRSRGTGSAGRAGRRRSP